MRNIVLTGFMGTGKSSVGVKLAKKLGYRYCDLDSLITDEAGMTINRIFEQYGERHFRDIESSVIERISSMENLVISSGGGAVVRDKNRELLRSSGVIVNLIASAEEIFSRLCSDTSRPLLKDNMSLERIGMMLEEREPFYAEADIRIDTSGKKVEDVVREILLYLEGKI
jgi:shikimate kinase